MILIRLRDEQDHEKQLKIHYKVTVWLVTNHKLLNHRNRFSFPRNDDDATKKPRAARQKSREKLDC